MEIYGWVVHNFPVIRKWSRWIRPKSKEHGPGLLRGTQKIRAFWLVYVVKIRGSTFFKAWPNINNKYMYKYIF